MIPTSAIGDVIRERRKALGMSADELSEKLGVNRATIFRYENGKISDVPAALILPLAQELEIDPIFLLKLGATQKKNSPGVDSQGKIKVDEVFEHFGMPGFLKDISTYGMWENTESGLARIKGLAEVLAKSRRRYQAVTIFRDAQYPVVLAVMIEDGEALTYPAAGAPLGKDG